jgi:hypothetical protein
MKRKIFALMVICWLLVACEAPTESLAPTSTVDKPTVLAKDTVLPTDESVETLPDETIEPLQDTNQGTLVEVVTAEGRTLFLPKQPFTESTMGALIDGLLIEVNGCLRVNDDNYIEGFLIVWPYDTDIEIAGENVDLLNSNGQVVARVGEALRIAGVAMESPPSMARYDDLIPGLPIDGCPGPYWVAGELETLASQAVPDIYVDPFTSDGRLLAFFIHQSRPARNEGSLSGTLLVNDQGCIQVEGNTILWPPGVYLREDPLSTVVKRRLPTSEKRSGLVGPRRALRNTGTSATTFNVLGRIGAPQRQPLQANRRLLLTNCPSSKSLVSPLSINWVVCPELSPPTEGLFTLALGREYW